MTMTNPDAKLKDLIVRHEGYRRFPYRDTLGNLTIGIGYNLDARGMNDTWINQQYQEDVNYFTSQLTLNHPCFSKLSEVRQAVLINMAFMGYKRLSQFYKMFRALECEDYALAAREMLDSYWAQQLPKRARELAKMMETGKWSDS